MTIVDSKVFFRLTQFWENLLGDPKEVALSAEYLPNLLQPAGDALKACHRRRRKAGDEEVVELKGETDSDADVAVRLLRDALNADPVIALIRWEAPDLVARLEGLLAEEVVDAVEVAMALRALQVVLSSEDLVRRAITAQLASGAEADMAVLQGAAVVLACRNIGRFPETQLKNLMNRSFARAVSLVVLEEHADRIRRELKITGALEALDERVIRTAVARGGTADEERGGNDAPAEADLFALFGGNHTWRRSAYRLLAQARRLWSEELGRRTRGPDESVRGLGQAVASLAEDREAQRRMARDIVLSYVAYGFRQRFRTVVQSGVRKTDPILEEAAGALVHTQTRG